MCLPRRLSRPSSPRLRPQRAIHDHPRVSPHRPQAPISLQNGLVRRPSPPSTSHVGPFIDPPWGAIDRPPGHHRFPTCTHPSAHQPPPCLHPSSLLRVCTVATMGISKGCRPGWPMTIKVVAYGRPEFRLTGDLPTLRAQIWEFRTPPRIRNNTGMSRSRKPSSKILPCALTPVAAPPEDGAGKRGASTMILQPVLSYGKSGCVLDPLDRCAVSRISPWPGWREEVNNRPESHLLRGFFLEVGR